MRTGETVLVQGAGMLGLTASALALAYGAERVFLSDTDPVRLAQASHFGAEPLLVEDSPENLRRRILDTTDGRGVDVALEMSGALASIRMGLELLRTGGRYIWVGSVFPSRAISVSPEQVVRRQLMLAGVHNYTPADLSKALRLLPDLADNYPFADMVERTFTLDEAEHAFTFARVHRPYRVGVRPIS